MSSESVKKRRSDILSMLTAQGSIRSSRLQALLNVSDETVRKDLTAMEAQGILTRRHGLVELLTHDDEQMLDVRSTLHLPQKERIAAAALEMIPAREGDVIGLDVGSTTLCLARLLARRKNQTFVTNDMRIADAFAAANANNNIYCAGGLLRCFDKALYGPWTLKCLRSVRMTVSVLAACGVHNWNGLGAVSYEDVDVKATYAKNSAMSIALLDSSKFSANALLEAVPWERLDAVITDEGIPEADRERIERKTRLVIV